MLQQNALNFSRDCTASNMACQWLWIASVWLLHWWFQQHMYCLFEWVSMHIQHCEQPCCVFGIVKRVFPVLSLLQKREQHAWWSTGCEWGHWKEEERLLEREMCQGLMICCWEKIAAWATAGTVLWFRMIISLWWECTAASGWIASVRGADARELKYRKRPTISWMQKAFAGERTEVLSSCELCGHSTRWCCPMMRAMLMTAWWRISKMVESLRSMIRYWHIHSSLEVVPVKRGHSIWSLFS